MQILLTRLIRYSHQRWDKMTVIDLQSYKNSKNIVNNVLFEDRVFRCALVADTLQKDLYRGGLSKSYVYGVATKQENTYAVVTNLPFIKHYLLLIIWFFKFRRPFKSVIKKNLLRNDPRFCGNLFFSRTVNKKIYKNIIENTSLVDSTYQ